MAHQNDYFSEDDKGRVYLDFYNFKEPPFNITPDPEFLFLSNTHQSVIDQILYGINNRMGFILLIGEVGTGKTTICRSILDSLNENAETVYIINPSLSGEELISSVLDDLEIKYKPDSTKKELLDHLNHFLLSRSNSKSVVIIIDDAQTMPIDALENLRLLSNLETDKDKLIQMVLVGQPELLDLLSQPEIRQLRQRVGIKSYLEYLTRDEVGGYISRRLFIAGNKGQVHFTQGAIKHIFKASKGIPRLINKICDYALTAGYIANDFTINSAHVHNAISELGELDFKDDTSASIKPEQKKAGTRIFMPLSLLAIFILSIILCYTYLPEFEILIKNAAVKQVSSPKTYPINIKKEMPEQKPTSNEIESTPVAPEQTDKKVELAVLPPETQNAPKDTPDSKKLSVTVPIFALHLGSFKTIDNTFKAVDIFKNMGIESHWHKVFLREKGTWYRLFTGRFEDKVSAEQFKKDHGLLDSIIVSAPWTILAHQATSPDDFDNIRSVLQDKEYDFYIIKTEEAVYKLLTGMFATKKEAEGVVKKINNLGIETSVVHR